MGDLNANGVPNQAEINAQLQAGQAQLTASLNALAAQLNQLGQGNRLGGQPAARGFGPYLEHPHSQSEGEDSDQEPPDRRGPGRTRWTARTSEPRIQAAACSSLTVHPAEPESHRSDQPISFPQQLALKEVNGSISYQGNSNVISGGASNEPSLKTENKKEGKEDDSSVSTIFETYYKLRAKNNQSYGQLVQRKNQPVNTN
ncbi:hypothetical protein Bca101_059721 [Brassica carinata]